MSNSLDADQACIHMDIFTGADPGFLERGMYKGMGWGGGGGGGEGVFAFLFYLIF